MNPTPGCDSLYPAFLSRETPHFLLQDGLFTIPLIGSVLKETGQIPVYRGTKRARDAKAQAYAILRAGGMIVIFPEGKDVTWGQRISAKIGAVRMAIETAAPIIPLGLYAPPQSLTTLNFDWQGSPRSGEWQCTGKSYMSFGVSWTTVAQAMFKSIEDLMNRICSLVAEAEREGQCVSHTWLNPMLR